MNSPISRRDFLRSGAAIVALAGLCGTRAALAADSSQVALRTETVRLPGLPRSFEGFRIGLLTDPHLGPWVRHELVEAGVRLLNSEHVDLALLGGDFIGIPDAFPRKFLPYTPNHTFSNIARPGLPEAIYAHVADLLGGLKAAHGPYAVYGNHDNWVEPDLCAAKLGRKRIRVLKNEQVILQRGADELLLVGCDDYWTGTPRFPKLGKSNSRQARVLLTHNPDYVSYLLESTQAEFDLALCGHTHGGQIRLPGIGALHYNIEDTRFGEGLVVHPRGHVYTSRGIGVVALPFRLNCPPEVNVLMLSSG